MNLAENFSSITILLRWLDALAISPSVLECVKYIISVLFGFFWIARDVAQSRHVPHDTPPDNPSLLVNAVFAPWQNFPVTSHHGSLRKLREIPLWTDVTAL